MLYGLPAFPDIHPDEASCTLSPYFTAVLVLDGDTARKSGEHQSRLSLYTVSTNAYDSRLREQSVWKKLCVVHMCNCRQGGFDQGVSHIKLSWRPSKCLRLQPWTSRLILHKRNPRRDRKFFETFSRPLWTTNMRAITICWRMRLRKVRTL